LGPQGSEQVSVLQPNVHAINKPAVIPEFCPDLYHACFIDLGFICEILPFISVLSFMKGLFYRHPFVNEAKFR
jgi:hypothetical protein